MWNYQKPEVPEAPPVPKNPLMRIPKIIELDVVGIFSDHGDGGGSVTFYNNEDELIADHYDSRRGKMTPERRKEILTEDNPHEDGYIGRNQTLKIKIDENGKVTLAQSFHSSWGQ